MKAHFTVTDLDAMAWFRRLDDMTADELCQRLMRTGEANEKMLLGTAWHSILENPPADGFDTIEHDGFTFKIDCDAEICMPQVREIRASKTYRVGGVDVTLSGGCDGIDGTEVTDHKLTFNPRPENYTASFQWRSYLDIFNADSFRYYIYHGKQDGKVVTIRDVSTMRLHRYPDMVADVMRGIEDLLFFVMRHLPERVTD